MIAMLLMVRGTAWAFVSQACFAALDSFTTWLPKDTVAGVNVVCANPAPLATKRKSKRTVPPQNNFVPYFAGTERGLWK
jgi:hypothetical protein